MASQAECNTYNSRRIAGPVLWRVQPELCWAACDRRALSGPNPGGFLGEIGDIEHREIPRNWISGILKIHWNPHWNSLNLYESIIIHHVSYCFFIFFQGVFSLQSHWINDQTPRVWFLWPQPLWPVARHDYPVALCCRDQKAHVPRHETSSDGHQVRGQNVQGTTCGASLACTSELEQVWLMVNGESYSQWFKNC